MTAVLAVTSLVAVIAGSAATWWYRRQAQRAEAARKIERALRLKAQDEAKIAQSIAEHQARVANALYTRLREEDQREVDAISSAGDSVRAADFLRTALGGGGSPEGGGVPDPGVPTAAAPTKRIRVVLGKR